MVCELSGHLEIPSSVSFQDIDWKVVAIGETSFAWSNLQSIIIPETVTEIKSHAFVKCFNLVDVTIPESVETIGSAAFQECTSLPSITLPSNISNIQTYCFIDCESLKYIDFPSNIKYIGYYAFYNCPSLETLHFNSSPTIEDEAFTKSPNIQAIYLNTTIPPTGIATSIFQGIVYMNGILYVPYGYKDTYSTSYPWSEFSNIKEYDFSGIEEIKEDGSDTILFYFNSSGIISHTPFAGLNFIKYSNGVIKKEFIK